MHVTLFGEVRLNYTDWAQDLIRKGLEKPFLYFIMSNPGKQSIIVIDEKGKRQKLNVPGLYAIYQGNDCLYVGFSGTNVWYRLSRFKKELIGMSRPDENHPGAARAREKGYTTDLLYKVKFIPLDEVITEKFAHLGLDESHVDEYIAPLLNSKFNKKVRK